ncbi:GPI-anchor transamidase [Plasmodiophora brassicae]|uniref:GPI-anchor transamidase n=1 Tax=Plasmodiophora brassicae TaxID=37360 RepID=A0A3P3YNJ4_PLABS|nr:unnamed protein product [Plasmodiophora brassicae]
MTGQRSALRPLTVVVMAIAAAASHSNNWAVLVDTSRYWFNYRHIADTLSFYHTVKAAGIPDSQIILMLADDMACNPRNAFPAQMFNNREHDIDLYGDDIEVDYRGTDVTVENFIRVLTNRHSKGTAKSRRLLTDESSNILIFMAGHGGDEFLKFQDQEEITSQDLADAFEQMAIQRRFNEILFIIDTCQASTMHNRFKTRNVMSIGSSAKSENSYSHHSDANLGVSVIDRFTFYALEFLEKHLSQSARLSKTRSPSLQDFFDHFTYSKLHSHHEYRVDLFDRPASSIDITDFFSAVTHVEPTPYTYPVTPKPAGSTKLPSSEGSSASEASYSFEDRTAPRSSLSSVAIVSVLVICFALSAGLDAMLFQPFKY